MIKTVIISASVLVAGISAPIISQSLPTYEQGREVGLYNQCSQDIRAINYLAIAKKPLYKVWAFELGYKSVNCDRAKNRYNYLIDSY